MTLSTVPSANPASCLPRYISTCDVDIDCRPLNISGFFHIWGFLHIWGVSSYLGDFSISGEFLHIWGFFHIFGFYIFGEISTKLEPTIDSWLAFSEQKVLKMSSSFVDNFTEFGVRVRVSLSLGDARDGLRGHARQRAIAFHTRRLPIKETEQRESVQCTLQLRRAAGLCRAGWDHRKRSTLRLSDRVG